MDRKDIVRTFDKRKKISMSRLASQHKNTRVCQSFYDGDFMDYTDDIQFKTKDGQKKKVSVKFNKIKPYVNAVRGFLIQNRSRAKYQARIEDTILQDAYSKYANALADYLRQNCDADQVETRADLDMLVNGYGAVETAIAYGEGYASNDEGGEMIMGRLDPLSVYWDPNARSTNLLDARWVFYKKEFELDEAMALFDDAQEQDFETNGDLGKNGDYQYFPGGGTYDKIRTGYDWAKQEENLVNVYFYQWYDIENYYKSKNPIYKITDQNLYLLTVDQMDALAVDNEDFDPRAEILTYDAAMKNKLEEVFPGVLEHIEFKKKVFYGAILSGQKLFTYFKLPSQQGFTIKFKTGDFKETGKIWIGMVNSMMEPMKYYNKSLSELMFIIAANSKGGVIVEESAVSDITDFEAKYAKTDAVIVVNDGAVSGNKIRPKGTPVTLTGYENIVSIADAALVDVNGIDKTFLGSSENREETGILQRRRIRQITASLSNYVDAILLYQKQHGRLMLDLMRIFAENNEGALFRILGEKGGSTYAKISSDKLLAEYEILVNEAPQTVDEKSEYVDVLVNIADKLMAAGDQTARQIYSLAIKYLPIDPEDRQKVSQIMEAGNQQIDPAYVQQLEATIQQMQSEQNMTMLQNTAANTAYTMAKADEAKYSAQVKEAQAVKILADAESVDKDIQVKEANVLKTLAETDRTEIETELAERGPPVSSVNVTL